MPYPRLRRMEELVRQELAKIIAYDLNDPRVGSATVTKVTISKDLSEATVYVSLLEDDPAEMDEALAGLEAATGYIKRLLGGRIVLRRLPDLRFRRDKTLQQANRIEELLHRIEREAPPSTQPEEEDDEDAPS